MAWYDLFVNRRGLQDTSISSDIIDEVGTIKERIIGAILSLMEILKVYTLNLLMRVLLVYPLVIYNNY